MEIKQQTTPVIASDVTLIITVLVIDANIIIWQGVEKREKKKEIIIFASYNYCK